jgi:hypothetical protein
MSSNDVVLLSVYPEIKSGGSSGAEHGPSSRENTVNFIYIQ